jgi:hypothetical protein
VNAHIGELVMPTDVVVVTVRCYRGDVLVEEIDHRRGEAHESHAGVDDEVAITTAQMPDVAPHQRDHVRFPQQSERVVDGLAFEPTVGDG